MKTKQYGHTEVMIFNTRDEMGKKAAEDATDRIRSLLEVQDEVNLIFAAAPSQDDFIRYFIKNQDIPWSRINVFHMDEYIGLGIEHPQSFARFLKDRVFDKLPFGKVHYIDGLNDPTLECRRYENLLQSTKLDIVFMGIGENGHIAFNDPGEADFNDLLWVKEVTLDERCRTQQVNDGCFSHIDDVPRTAITLTIPALMQPEYVYCIVPTDRKAEAVHHAMLNPVSEECPASILQKKENSRLYLDIEAAMYLAESHE